MAWSFHGNKSFTKPVLIYGFMNTYEFLIELIKIKWDDFTDGSLVTPYVVMELSQVWFK